MLLREFICGYKGQKLYKWTLTLVREYTLARGTNILMERNEVVLTYSTHLFLVTSLSR